MTCARQKKPPRLRYEIRRMTEGWWAFIGPGPTVLQTVGRKSDLVWQAAQELAQAWDTLCVRSELVIKRADGTIQDCRTYGDDPRGTKG